MELSATFRVSGSFAAISATISLLSRPNSLTGSSLKRRILIRGSALTC